MVVRVDGDDSLALEVAEDAGAANAGDEKLTQLARK